MYKHIETNNKYKHFVQYDQECFDGIKYGSTDLFYKVDKSTLHIKKYDQRLQSETEMKFPVENQHEKVEIILENFLIDYLSYSDNFEGYPIFIKSKLFSQESFQTILDKAIARRKERFDKAKLLNAENELIKYCKSIHLSPQPQGDSPTNWQANCPSGGQHHIMISTKSNQWGCGYCRIKGDINSLRAYYDRKTKSV